MSGKKLVYRELHGAFNSFQTDKSLVNENHDDLNLIWNGLFKKQGLNMIRTITL